MMTKSQFKRLTLVLIFPLLLLGVWIAENEVLLEHHHMMECSEGVDDFSCTAFQISGPEWSNAMFQGGVFISSAHLSDGLNADIETLGMMHSEFKDGRMVDKELVGANIRKRLVISPRAGANYLNGGPRLLSPFANSETDWSLTSSLLNENFKFTVPSVAGKYARLWQTVQQKNETYRQKEILAYGVSVAFPIIVYFLLTIALLLFVKIICFVVGKKQTA